LDHGWVFPGQLCLASTQFGLILIDLDRRHVDIGLGAGVSKPGGSCYETVPEDWVRFVGTEFRGVSGMVLETLDVFRLKDRCLI
jgi:hypothetical protein